MSNTPAAPSTDSWLTEMSTFYGDTRKADFAREKSTIKKYLAALATELLGRYSLARPIAVGGTGIVFLGKDDHLSQEVVIKFNRPNIPSLEASMVTKETRILPGLTHHNIINVLHIGSKRFPPATNKSQTDCPDLTYIVEPFIKGSAQFFTHSQDEPEKNKTWLWRQITQLEAQLPDPRYDAGQTIAGINALLADLGIIFSQWTSALYYLHNCGYVYLDVKPDNVLIAEHTHLTAIDFGSVETIDCGDHSPIDVFFTKRYAHPVLLHRQVEKASSNRVRGGIKRSELAIPFDYYALGICLLEALHEVASIRPHVVPQLPLFRSLHFLATRLLDGQNRSQPPVTFKHAPQIFPGLEAKHYTGLKYDNLNDVERDLRKERGGWNIEDHVPELATYSKHIVRLVPGFNTVQTERLRGVLEHPLVGRLKFVSQLGLVSLVYPTADHARYDHVLGTYTYVTNYIRYLFNDLGNPIFRNLVGIEDLHAVLLASLLHDLGQYPLAHDLEEVHPGIFKHTRIGLSLLEDTTTDRRGRTLKTIIEDSQNGWDVRVESLRRILTAHSRNEDLVEQVEPRSFKYDVLSAIIDGPVDADKADYIVRDSARCELPYGQQLDLERFFRVLTVAIIPDETLQRRVTLGVYDKGIASAHAFGQARYQLLATVYWHHTSRIAKAMLQYATAMGLPPEVFWSSSRRGSALEAQIREKLVVFVKALVPPFEIGREAGQPDDRPLSPLDMMGEPSESVVAELPLADIQEPHAASEMCGEAMWYTGVAWTDWLMLRWIANLPQADQKSRNLITGIQSRQLYKRVATLNRGGTHESVIGKLDGLDWPKCIALCENLHRRVQERLEQDWGDLQTRSLLKQDEFSALCEHNLLILVDVPRPSNKVGYERPLGVVPELKERSYHQDARLATEDKRWKKTMQSMIEAIAPVRILCHPQVANLVSLAYEQSEHSLVKELEGVIAEV